MTAFSRRESHRHSRAPAPPAGPPRCGADGYPPEQRRAEHIPSARCVHAQCRPLLAPDRRQHLNRIAVFDGQPYLELERRPAGFIAEAAACRPHGGPGRAPHPVALPRRPPRGGVRAPGGAARPAPRHAGQRAGCAPTRRSRPPPARARRAPPRAAPRPSGTARTPRARRHAADHTRSSPPRAAVPATSSAAPARRPGAQLRLDLSLDEFRRDLDAGHASAASTSSRPAAWRPTRPRSWSVSLRDISPRGCAPIPVGRTHGRARAPCRGCEPATPPHGRRAATPRRPRSRTSPAGCPGHARGPRREPMLDEEVLDAPSGVLIHKRRPRSRGSRAIGVFGDDHRRTSSHIRLPTPGPEASAPQATASTRALPDGSSHIGPSSVSRVTMPAASKRAALRLGSRCRTARP